MCKNRDEMKSIFNVIAAPDSESCCILLYGEIGSWGEVTAQDIVGQLLDAQRTYKKIDVRINSVGGEVSTGIAIFNALRASTAEVTIYIDCLAASTASFIASCGRPVKMSRYARIMIHRPTGFVGGNADELKSYIDQLQGIENIICDIYAQRTGLSVDEVRSQYMDGADHWLTADEAVALGFADEIFDDVRDVKFAATLSPAQRCEHYTDCYLESVKNVSLKNQNHMFEQLRKRPTFSDCADEAAIMARIDEIEAKANKHDTVVAENTSLKDRINGYEKKEQEALDAAIIAEVGAAVTEGRIGEDQREHFVQMLHTEKADDARAILKSLKPKYKVSDLLGKGKPGAPTIETDKELLAKREAEVRAKLNLN